MSTKRGGGGGMTHQKQQPPLPAPSFLKAPARTTTNMLEIERRFKENVLDQPMSINRLSSTLSSMLKRSANDQSRFLWTLCGPIGTGKRTTVRFLRHFLGMDVGYEYAQQYIEFEAATENNNVSFSDCHDILTKIKKSLETATTLPPYVLLFIHGFQDASYNFKTMLNTLLRDGAYRDVFTLPPDVALLIVCASDWGSDDIMKMTKNNNGRRCDDSACELIKKAMKASITNQLINRIDLILPYYPLKIETMRTLLGVKFENSLLNSSLVKRFGPDRLKTTAIVKDMLINHVLAKVDSERSMHSVERVLTDKLTTLIETGMSVIDSMEKGERIESIFLEKFSFDTSLLSKIFTEEIDKVTTNFLTSIKNHPANEQFLENVDSGRNGRVDTLTMRCNNNNGEEVALCGLIMNITYVTINNYYNAIEDEESARLNDELKECLEAEKLKVKKLKGCLIEVNAAAEKEHHGTINTIIKNNKELFNESSDESGEEKTSKSSPCKSQQQPLLLTQPPLQPNKRKALEDVDEENDDVLKKKIKKARLRKLEEEEEEGEEEEEEEEELSFTIESEEEEGECDDDDYAGFNLLYSREHDEGSFADAVMHTEEEYLFMKRDTTYEPKKRGRPYKYKEIDGFTRLVATNRSYSWQCNKCSHIVSRREYTCTHTCGEIASSKRCKIKKTTKKKGGARSRV